MKGPGALQVTGLALLGTGLAAWIHLGEPASAAYAWAHAGTAFALATVSGWTPRPGVVLLGSIILGVGLALEFPNGSVIGIGPSLIVAALLFGGWELIHLVQRIGSIRTPPEEDGGAWRRRLIGIHARRLMAVTTCGLGVAFGLYAGFRSWLATRAPTRFENSVEADLFSTLWAWTLLWVIAVAIVWAMVPRGIIARIRRLTGAGTEPLRAAEPLANDSAPPDGTPQHQ